MARMLLIFLLAAACQLASANVIGPIIYEQKDLGDISLKEFVYSMSADCTAGTVTLSVMDENYTSLQGAGTLLSYVDFSTGLISHVDTDNQGIAILKLPGNVNLMRGMFILVIEKYGFRNKEIHFDLSPCYTNATQKPPKPKPVTQNTTNQTKPPIPNQTIPNITNASNASGNSTQHSNNASNSTGSSTAPSEGSLCPAAILMACLALLGGVFVSMRRRKAWGTYGKEAGKGADGK
jgi:hypothetical protein